MENDDDDDDDDDDDGYITHHTADHTSSSVFRVTIWRCQEDSNQMLKDSRAVLFGTMPTDGRRLCFSSESKRLGSSQVWADGEMIKIAIDSGFLLTIIMLLKRNLHRLPTDRPIDLTLRPTQSSSLVGIIIYLKS